MERITVGVLFTCVGCGYNNKISRSVKKSLKLWLLDKLPPCKKCFYQLKKDDYRDPEDAPYLEELKVELGIH
jgi:hypothetical protein